jgi:hypothetical protein
MDAPVDALPKGQFCDRVESHRRAPFLDNENKD